MSGPLLARCEHCGIDPERIMRARRAVLQAACELGLDPAHPAVTPSLEYEAGALHALSWVLGAGDDHFFELHIAALEKKIVATRDTARARLNRSA